MSQPYPRPRFHMTAPSNWVNDPNGPVFWGGRYHLFYQHNPERPAWGNIHWGHASSRDLIDWTDHGIAMAPSPGPDELGCWSGCARVTERGVEFFYTGVSPLATGGTLQSVCLATGDGDLSTLRKYPGSPLIAPIDRDERHHPYRDPFVLYDNERERWLMILGSGISNRDGSLSGCVVAYESMDRRAWTYVGVIFDRVEGDPDLDSGPIWECPQLVQFGDEWALIVSVQLPLAGSESGDAAGVKCAYAVWFVGDFDGSRFEPRSSGILDAGGVFYAPAIMEAPDGRTLMWGWVQETAEQELLDEAGFAGAIGMPRTVAVRDGRLVTRPVDELGGLFGPPTQSTGVDVEPDSAASHRLGDSLGCVQLKWTPQGVLAGLQIGTGDGARSLAITVDGRAAHSRLVVLSVNDGVARECAAADLAVRVDEPIELFVYVDNLIVEAFTSTGDSITVRRDASLSSELHLTAWDGMAHFDEVAFQPLISARSRAMSLPTPRTESSSND